MNKVLIIEDNSFLLDSVSDFLKEEGFEIYTALNGEEGVAMALQHLPDIILSDIYMPKMNGYQVFDALKKNPATALIPFIFISAKSEKEDILYGLRLGADDYIIKPIHFPELLRRVMTRIEKTKNTMLLSEVKYEALFETANDAILMVRMRDSMIVDANPAAYKLLGYQMPELIDTSGKEIIDPDQDERSFLSGSGAAYYGDFFLVETSWRSKDGKRIPIHVSGKRIQLVGEEFIFLIARDITELKAKEQQIINAKERAEESDRLKSSILANMSHELRTPLNGILGFAEILKDELPDPNFKVMADNIFASGKWLMNTLDAILMLSQLEAGKIRIVASAVDVFAITHEIAASLESQVSEKHIHLTNLVPSALRLTTDERLFKQLVRQIIDNAVKFTEKGGVTVEAVRTAKDGDEWIEIKVTDTGIGIESKNLDMIFHEFRQVSEGLSRKFQGSGLGLTICRKIMELLGGEILVESEPGKGSIFTIRLPMSHLHVSPEMRADIKVLKRPEKAKSVKDLPLVLIVEDNFLNKELTGFFLKSTCRLDHAPDGETAVRMASKESYAAILMDINLGPGIDGLEATRKIRKLDNYHAIPVIALTGYIITGDEEKRLLDVCTNYISKPYDKISLINIVTEALEKKKI